ncbi:MAG: ABC transporter ATP-binding protein [Pseudomonadota bacterium]
MTASESYISIRGVGKSFGAVQAVEEISFDIRRGEFFSLLGPSGCGKTTLLRMLAGFEQPSRGEILIDGQPMSKVAPNRRPTNMVFQNYAIFPHLDVRANIGYGLARLRLPKKELDTIVDQALETIKLPGYGSRRPDQLSGGQRQRVALARALVCKPKVLLLDEPLGALDKKLREEMQLELRQIQRQVGITFVFVTHDQEEALTMSDRIAIMAKGKVLQIDTATRIYETPNCRTVAEFIGTMNFFEGVVKAARGAEMEIDGGPLGTMLVAANDFRPAVGARVSVAIRPEKLRLLKNPASPGPNTIAGRMGPEAYLGDRSHYYIEAPGHPQRIAVAAQKLTRSVEACVDEGQGVWLNWAPEAAVLLPTS